MFTKFSHQSVHKARQVTLRPPLAVCHTYHHPLQRCWFIVISIKFCIIPSQTHESVVEWSPLDVSMGDKNHSCHFGAMNYSISGSVKYHGYVNVQDNWLKPPLGGGGFNIESRNWYFDPQWWP